MGDDATLRARDFYAIYCASSDGKNYQGLSCPAWEGLTPAVRGHWYTVALRSLQIEGNIVVSSDGHVGLDPPDQSSIGHLPDQTHALEVWLRYSGGLA